MTHCSFSNLYKLFNYVAAFHTLVTTLINWKCYLTLHTPYFIIDNNKTSIFFDCYTFIIKYISSNKWKVCNHESQWLIFSMLCSYKYTTYMTRDDIKFYDLNVYSVFHEMNTKKEMEHERQKIIIFIQHYEKNQACGVCLCFMTLLWKFLGNWYFTVFNEFEAKKLNFMNLMRFSFELSLTENFY